MANCILLLGRRSEKTRRIFMRKILAILIFSIIFSFLALPWERGGGDGISICSAYVLDKVVAVVNDHVITESDVDRAVEVEKTEGTPETGKPAVGISASAASARKKALDSLIDRALLIDEARKFNLATVKPGEVEDAYRQVKAGYPDEKTFRAALDNEEITKSELKNNLRDQLLVVKYIDRRIKAFVRITPDEEKKYYERHKKDFGGKKFEDAEPAIKSLLTERETNRKLEDYLRDLKSKADIIINP